MSKRPILACALACVLLPSLAAAQPLPANCTVPAHIQLQTPRNGAPGPAATYTVVVKDFFFIPLAGVPVTLSFGGCTQVAPEAEQTYPGMTSSCAPLTLTAITNAAGEATFSINGAVLHRAGAGTQVGCVSVTAGGVAIGTTTPSAFDEDGVNGLTANDLSLWLCDFGSAINVARSDLNGDGALSPLDLLAWLNDYYAANGVSRTGTRCDGGPNSTGLNPVASPSLKIAWNNCPGDGGSATHVYACNANTGAETLDGSFTAPAGAVAVTGFEAELELVGSNVGALADWWRFDAAGCRPTAMIVDLSYPDIGGACPRGELDTGSWSGNFHMYYPDPVAPAANRAFIRIIGAFPGTTPITAGQDYSLFHLRFTHAKTVGAGACAGCSAPVAVLFRRLKLTQAQSAPSDCSAPALAGPTLATATGDFYIDANAATTDWIAYWQGVPPGFAASLDSPPPAPPVRIELAATNPSRGTSHVEFALPRPMRCTLALYDVSGRRRATLVDEVAPAGSRSLTWNGRDDGGAVLESGYYVLRLVTDDGVITRPIIRVR